VGPQAVNTLVQVYVDNNLEGRLQARQKMVDWLDEQLADQLNKVRASERKLAEYRESQSAPTLDQQQNIVTPRLKKLGDDSIRAAAKRLEKEVLYKRVKAMPPDSAADVLPLVAHSASLKALNAELRGLEQERAQLAQRYGEKHPAIQAFDTRLAETRRRRDAEFHVVLQSLENDYKAAVLEERSVAVETLRSSHPHFFGAVLNRVDVVRNKYYYSRHYGYQYKGRYADSA